MPLKEANSRIKINTLMEGTACWFCEFEKERAKNIFLLTSFDAAKLTFPLILVKKQVERELYLLRLIHK
jgi:hypothetical protein